MWKDFVVRLTYLVTGLVVGAHYADEWGLLQFMLYVAVVMAVLFVIEWVLPSKKEES